MNASGIRNLLFDLGNVIIDLDTEGCMQRMHKLLRSDANDESINHVQLEFERGRLSSEIFINTILRESHRHVQAIDVVEAWNSMLVGIPSYRLEMLRMLRSNFNVYLLSNTNPLHLEWIHRYLKRVYQIENFEKEYFDQAYYSHLIGDRKPLPSIYKHVIDDSLLTPGLTLYMDDMADNIKVARSLGFQTYLVKEGEEIAEFLKVHSYY